MTNLKDNSQICNNCKHLRSLEDFSKEYKVDGSTYFRKICKRCRNKKRRERQKEQDYWSKKYWSMTADQRSEYIKNKSEQNKKRFKTNPEALLKKKMYEKTDKGVYNRYRNECNRRGRKTRGIQVLLTFEQFSDLINQKCHYCGLGNCRGLDRIDSFLSYTLENSVPCCRICNQMKNDLNKEDFIKHLKKIVNNLES